eukprot:COSAG01_NODE_5231_length_4396_cov_4.301373_5_plen_175_part_00
MLIKCKIQEEGRGGGEEEEEGVEGRSQGQEELQQAGRAPDSSAPPPPISSSPSSPSPSSSSQLNHTPAEDAGLQQLLVCLGQRTAFLENKARRSSTDPQQPTPAQMGAFLRESVQLIGRCQPLPSWARELLDDAFGRLGWDRDANASCPGSQPPTVVSCAQVLAQTRDGVEMMM